MKRSHRVISASATVFVAGAFVLAGGVAPASAADGNVVVDDQLRACINVTNLKKPASAPITRAQFPLENNQINCGTDYLGITTFEGLQGSGIRRIKLEGSNQLDLAEVNEILSLSELRLQNATVAAADLDLGVLTNSFNTLTQFAIVGATTPDGVPYAVDEVTGLENFPKVYELNVNMSGATTLGNVAALSGLRDTYWQFNYLDADDLRDIQGLTKLTALRVQGNNITDLSWVPKSVTNLNAAAQHGLVDEMILKPADSASFVADPTRRPIDRDGTYVARENGTADVGPITFVETFAPENLVIDRYIKYPLEAPAPQYGAYEWRSKTKPNDALSYIAYPVVEVDLRDNLALSATVGESVTLSPIDFSYDTGVSARATTNIPTFEATSFAVAEGALPEGLTLSATDGTIAGMPTAEGSATFTIVATDALGNDVIGNYAVAVAPAATTDADANTNGGDAEATANASASEGTSTADGATANADGSEGTANANGTEAAAQAAGNAVAIAAADGATANADGSEATATTDGTGDALGAGAGGAANGESANGTSSGTANADGATANADGSEATAAADGTEAAAQAAGNADAIAAANGEAANGTSNGTSEGTTNADGATANADGATANADGSEATAAADGTEAAAQAAGNADAIAAADGATANADGSEATATTDGTGDALGAGAGGAANGETASATSDGTATGSAADGDTANGADDESGANADTAGAEAGSDTNADATGGTSEAAVEGTSEATTEASADGATAEGTNDSATDGTTGDADAAGSEADADANGSEAGAAAAGSEAGAAATGSEAGAAATGSEAGAAANGSEAETEANATANATNGNGNATNGEKPADTNQSGDALAVTGVDSSAIVTAAVLALIALLAGAALLGRRRV